MVYITNTFQIDDKEIKFTFIRAPGPGGQNVNKVATGVQLRFNVLHSSSLSDDVKKRLYVQLASKITLTGDLIIKATNHRTQNRNKEEALQRLQALVLKALTPPKKRKKTKPTKASAQRRLDTKKLHGKKKTLRRSDY